MNTTTKVSISFSNRFVTLINYDLQPSHATVFDVPERPNAPAPPVSLFRHVDRSGADEENCPTDITTPGVSDVAESGQGERILVLRPSSKHQTNATTRTGPSHIDTSDSDSSDESHPTDDGGQFEPPREKIKKASADPPMVPLDDIQACFATLINNNGNKTTRKRTLILQNSPGSEAIDAGPCSPSPSTSSSQVRTP